MRHTGVKEFYPNNLHVLNLIDGIRKKKQSKTKHNKIKTTTTTTTTNKQIKKIKKKKTKRNETEVKKKKKKKRKTDRVRALIGEIEANSKSRHKLSIGPLLYPSIS